MRNFNFFKGGVAVATLALIAIFTCISTLNIYAQSSNQSQKIQFFIGNWSQVTEMSQLMKKPIFVNVYNTSAPACKRMENEVFQDTKVANFYESEFINFKLNLNSDEGMMFRSNYNLQEHSLRDYPVLLYFNANGDLLFKQVGEKSTNQFTDYGKQALKDNKKNSASNTSISSIYTNYLDLKLEYQNGNENPDFLYKYAYELKKFNDPYEHIVNRYLDSRGFANITSQKNLTFVYDFADDVDSKAFTNLLANKQYYVNLYGRAKVDQKIKHAVRTSVVVAATDKDNSAFNRSLKIIQKSKLTDSKAFTAAMQSLYYEKTRNWDAYANVMSDYIAAGYVQNADELNSTAWKFAVHVADKIALQNAYEWSEKALLQEKSNYKHYETQAALLYKLGKKSKALKMAEMGIEKARKKGDDYRSTLKLMEIINKNLDLPAMLEKK